jgi:hypothetical protein
VLAAETEIPIAAAPATAAAATPATSFLPVCK